MSILRKRKGGTARVDDDSYFPTIICAFAPNWQSFLARGRDIPHQSDITGVRFPDPVCTQTGRVTAWIQTALAARTAYSCPRSNLLLWLRFLHTWHPVRLRQLLPALLFGQKTKIALHPEEFSGLYCFRRVRIPLHQHLGVLLAHNMIASAAAWHGAVGVISQQGISYGLCR